ncbi:MAG TPA: hypothetical protein VI197_20820 [Polyangiaceae bacterium]
MPPKDPPGGETPGGEEVTLCFPPRKSYVAPATDFVTCFCGEHTADKAALSRVQLAAHELAENVVKYAAGQLCTVRVRSDRPTRNGGAVSLSITTENAVLPEALDRVDAYLCALEAASNPDHFYDQQIAETAKRVNGSGLGLARIRSEAGMEIQHRAGAGRLCITAVLWLPLAGDA